MINIAVFCSGNGTNLQAIINAVKTKKLKVNISLVVCDKKNAFALKRARKAGIKSTLVERSSFSSKKTFEEVIMKHLKREKVDLIVLAGYMRILGSGLLSAYKNRIINVHPSLLPAFKGAHGIKDAFLYGVKVTGVTIHFVDEKVDHGPIIMQESLPIYRDDTLATLEKRVHKVEHRLYYKAIALFASRRLKLRGRKVEIVKG
ncbi:phosphoribosylglycinamide formyltransferase [Thermoproteota archaeon]